MGLQFLQPSDFACMVSCTGCHQHRDPRIGIDTVSPFLASHKPDHNSDIGFSSLSTLVWDGIYSSQSKTSNDGGSPSRGPSVRESHVRKAPVLIFCSSSMCEVTSLVDSALE